MSFHPEGIGRDNSPTQNRAEKEGRVRAGQAHAALVLTADDDAAHDDDAPATAACVGWCQFDTPDELPRTKHQCAYREGVPDVPRWRITRFFVDKAYRHQVAAAALQGALDEIARLGGGGKNRWLVTAVVPAAPDRD